MGEDDSPAKLANLDDETVATVLVGSVTDVDQRPGVGQGGTEGADTRSENTSEGTSGKTSLPSEDTSSVTAVESTSDAMQLQEVDRVRAFMLFSSLMCVMVAALAPVLRKNPEATWFLAGTSALTAVTAFVLLRITKDAGQYRDWVGTLFSVIAANAVIAGFYFFGVTSAVLMIVPLGAYLLALGENIRAALFSHIYISVGHGVLSALQIMDIVPEVGLVRLAEDSTAERIGIALATQVVLLATFIMARGVREATVSTLEQLNAAVTDNARRAALLDEAKQELALARNVGGAGRFSEHVFGQFRLGDVLGRGAMGEVYEGVHVENGEFAAIKMLSFDAMRQPDLIARFLREMRIAKALRQENVVAVLAVSDPSEEIPFLAMERLRGGALSEKLREVGSLDLQECLELVTAVAKGVEAAHAVGIVHRDLKPSNLFLHEHGNKRTWKVLDFGVSKFMDDGDTLTAGAIVGTPSYMSPEQAKGEVVTTRSDVYALGVVMYRALTGRPAFGGAELPLVLHSVVYDMPPRPSAVAELSEDIDIVMAIAMAKNPSKRFATPTELAEALASAALGTLSEPQKTRGQQQMRAVPWGAG